MTESSSSRTPHKVKQIAIAIVCVRGHYLIGQRAEGVALAGMWEFPGGKVEAGESVFAAAERETLEETGLHMTAHEVLHVTEFEYAHDQVRLNFVACAASDDCPSATKNSIADLPPVASPFRWVPHAALADYSFPDGNREILAILGNLGKSPANGSDRRESL